MVDKRQYQKASAPTSGAGGAMPEGQISMDKSKIRLPPWTGIDPEDHVDIWYDEEENELYIEQDDEGDFTVKRRKVSARTVLSDLEIEHDERQRYEAESEDGGILVDTSEPVA